MYTGRILSIGMNCDGKPFVAYRVSSRSFPNRQCLKFDNRASIVPKEGFEKDIFEINTFLSKKYIANEEALLQILSNLFSICTRSNTKVWCF